METIPPPAPSQVSKSSKKWIFIGCGGCLTFVVLGLIAVGVFMAGIFSMIKSSGGYKDALARVKASPEVVAALGEPIETGFFVGGSTNATPTENTADIQFSVSGPNGTANVRYKGSKTTAEWEPTILTVTIEKDGVVFNLLDH